ncbi:hypothetical protein BpHYR1_005431 [Brachionus plicatilis]|uniref:EGF-like domain-containing protein n=1 Tax=Brachionus plicatilis TaxID=10195 RepID=A0A3M7SKE6_BRAPC|nr:hypothetical protein BpHYR1_005431 [Brachionus plicatilis]
MRQKVVLNSTTTTTTATPFDPNQFYFPCPQNVPNPCLNSGKCFYTNLTRTIICECRPGYIDTFCRNPFSIELSKINF